MIERKINLKLRLVFWRWIHVKKCNDIVGNNEFIDDDEMINSHDYSLQFTLIHLNPPSN